MELVRLRHQDQKLRQNLSLQSGASLKRKKKRRVGGHVYHWCERVVQLCPDENALQLSIREGRGDIEKERGNCCRKNDQHHQMSSERENRGQTLGFNRISWVRLPATVHAAENTPLPRPASPQALLCRLLWP